MALSLVRSLRPVRSFQPLSHWTSLTLSKTRQSASVRLLSSQIIKEPSLPVKSVLKFKSRPVKKRPAKPSSGLEEWNVVGYSAAESFDLFGIQDALRDQQLYTRVELPDELDPSCIYVYKECEFEERRRDILLFKEGCVVFWNVPELERGQVLSYLKPFSENSYEESTVFEE